VSVPPSDEHGEPELAAVVLDDRERDAGGALDAALVLDEQRVDRVLLGGVVAVAVVGEGHEARVQDHVDLDDQQERQAGGMYFSGRARREKYT